MFGSTDARAEYGGKGVSGSKGGTKLKTGIQIGANFSTPLVPKSSLRSSASNSEGKQNIKGEKEKVKKKANTPPSTPVVDGATGGCNEEESSTDDQGGSGTRSCFTKKKLNDFCCHLGDVLCCCFVSIVL